MKRCVIRKRRKIRCFDIGLFALMNSIISKSKTEKKKKKMLKKKDKIILW